MLNLFSMSTDRLPVKETLTLVGDDIPKYKLLLKGTMALTDAEIISIILTGSPGESVLLARRLLVHVKNNIRDIAKLSTRELGQLGITEHKATILIAAFELRKRANVERSKEKITITSSGDAYDVLYPHLDSLTVEHFMCLYLDRGNRIICTENISVGALNGTVADPKKIIRKALEVYASSIVLAHNHPSGGVRPSESDINLTRNLKNAAILLDMQVTDHIIVGDQSYYSFADSGAL